MSTACRVPRRQPQRARLPALAAASLLGLGGCAQYDEGGYGHYDHGYGYGIPGGGVAAASPPLAMGSYPYVGGYPLVSAYRSGGGYHAGGYAAARWLRPAPIIVSGEHGAWRGPPSIAWVAPRPAPAFVAPHRPPPMPGPGALAHGPAPHRRGFPDGFGHHPLVAWWHHDGAMRGPLPHAGGPPPATFRHWPAPPATGAAPGGLVPAFTPRPATAAPGPRFGGGHPPALFRAQESGPGPRPGGGRFWGRPAEAPQPEPGSSPPRRRGA
jgi:hypothetical protein